MRKFQKWTKTTEEERMKQRIKNEFKNSYVKELIQKYQRTGLKDDFEMVLEYTDNLVLKLFRKFKTRLPYLKTVEDQEVYNTSIVGLYSAVKSICHTTDSNLIPSKISSYIQAQLKQTFLYLERETLISDSEHLQHYCDNLSADRKFDEYMMFDLTEFKNRKIITPKEYRTIRDHIYKGIKTGEIAKREGVAHWEISRRITSAVEKMRYVVERGNLNRIVCVSKIPKLRRGGKKQCK